MSKGANQVALTIQGTFKVDKNGFHVDASSLQGKFTLNKADGQPCCDVVSIDSFTVSQDLKSVTYTAKVKGLQSYNTISGSLSFSNAIANYKPDSVSPCCDSQHSIPGNNGLRATIGDVLFDAQNTAIGAIDFKFGS